jgi:hypothetical protein
MNERIVVAARILAVDSSSDGKISAVVRLITNFIQNNYRPNDL